MAFAVVLPCRVVSYPDYGKKVRTMPKPATFNKKATAYVYKGSDWKDSEDDDWDIETLTTEEAGKTAHVGQRKIDGARCNVFSVGDGMFAAQKVGM